MGRYTQLSLLQGAEKAELSPLEEPTRATRTDGSKSDRLTGTSGNFREQILEGCAGGQVLAGGLENFGFPAQPPFGTDHFQQSLLLLGGPMEVASHPVGQFYGVVGSCSGNCASRSISLPERRTTS